MAAVVQQVSIGPDRTLRGPRARLVPPACACCDRLLDDLPKRLMIESVMLYKLDAVIEGTRGVQRLVLRFEECIAAFEHDDRTRAGHRHSSEAIVGSRLRLAELHAQLRQLVDRLAVEFDKRKLDPTPLLRVAETLKTADLPEARIALKRLEVRLASEPERPTFVNLGPVPPNGDAASLAEQPAEVANACGSFGQLVMGNDTKLARLGETAHGGRAERASPESTGALPDFAAASGELVIDASTMSVRGGEKALDLSRKPTLFRLIGRLHRARGTFVDTHTLKQDVWDRSKLADSTIRGAVSRLQIQLRAASMDDVADRIECRSGSWRLLPT